MKTITSITLTRLKIADAAPEVLPENPPERFAQVMARQEKFGRPRENPAGLDRERPAQKNRLAPGEKAKQEGSDPANNPEASPFLTNTVSNAAPPSPPNRPEDPSVDLKDPTLTSEQINPGSRIQPGPGEIPVKTAVPIVEAQNSILPGTLGETRGPDFLPGLLAQVREDFRITTETGPEDASALVRPEGASKENAVSSKAVGDLILDPAPESSPSELKVSPEKTEIVLRSFQTATENGPSFSPQGPAISQTTPVVDGLDPSPSLIFRKSEAKGPDSAPPPAPEIKPDFQASPSEPLPRTEKIAVAPSPIMEGPPIADADSVESNSKAITFAEKANSPATSKEILAERGISSLGKAEGPPDPEKTSRTFAGLDPKTSFLHRASWEKVEPGLSLQDPGENLSGSVGPDRNNPSRVQEDVPLGVMAKVLDQPRVEGVAADRVVEGPPKTSPEWIKEAFSVYQQYSKGLLRNLQQGGERIQMSLDPPQLGSILLEINRDRNFVTAHLWTDNPHTKELLDFSQAQLQKTLELDGFKLDRFEVLVQPDLKSFQEDRWFGGRQPAWENTRSDGSRASPDGLIPTSAETTTLRFNQGNQYVDTWV